MKKVAAAELKTKSPGPEEEAPRPIFGAAKDRILYLAPDEELLSTSEVWDAEPR